jgi:hypothetical protein
VLWFGKTVATCSERLAFAIDPSLKALAEKPHGQALKARP